MADTAVPGGDLLSYLVFGPWDGPVSVLLGSIWLAALYLFAAWRLRPSDEPPLPGWRVAAFLGGCLTVVVALYSPLHELSDRYLFTAHMVQHLLLTMIMPVLLLLGTPAWMLRPLLQPRPLRFVARVLTFPPVAFFLFNAAFAGSHVPAIYDLALRDEGLHALEHTVFMGAAMLAWWPALSPSPLLPPLPPPAAVLYLFLHTFPMLMVGAMITDASFALYPIYAAAPRVWDISAIQDQQMGGLLMWIGGSLFYLGVLTVIFFRWAAREDRKEPGRPHQYRRAVLAPPAGE